MSNIVLVHPFVNKCPDIDELLKDKNEHGVVCTINSLCYKIKTLSAKYSDRIDENQFKGDAWELFTEFFVKTNESDNRVGIYQYRPVTGSETEDLGVDGFGIGENGNPATVQAKFRSGDYILTANEDHLSNFLTNSWNDFNVKMEDTKNMLIITCGLKVDENTLQKMLKGKVRVLNREALRIMLDNRPEWWKLFFEAVERSRSTISVKKNPIVLRKHQMEAVQAIMNDSNKKGKIILPTGTGKTFIESDTIRRYIEEAKKTGNLSPIIKVNSSRILLCFQLFDEVFNYMRSYGIDARYVNFNSGDKDDSEFAVAMRQEGWNYRKILSTTKPLEVTEIYKDCQKNGLPLIIFSTYHSSDRFDRKIVPDLTIHDEAHNLVSQNFYVVAELETKAQFFFTATEKITDSDGDKGMNNVKRFDNMIYTKSAKEMIDAGEMVAPYLHVVRSSNHKRCDTDYELMFESIAQAFYAHERKIKEVSFNAAEIGAKVLVVCRGQQDLKQMFITKALAKFKEQYPDIHLYALSSDFGIYNDGIFLNPPVTNMKKYALLKAVRSLKSHEKAIVLHVDMVGEGIDVPGITGVMPFRNCEESKLIQNIGRSSRLHPEDRKKFYAGEISTTDKVNKWIKPYSWVIIPSYMVESEGLEDRFRFIVDRLRSEFGYIPQQHTVIDNPNGLDDPDPIDTVNEISKKKRQEKSGIDAFEHEFEKVSAIEKIVFEDNVTAKVNDILNLVAQMSSQNVTPIPKLYTKDSNGKDILNGKIKPKRTRKKKG